MLFEHIIYIFENICQKSYCKASQLPSKKVLCFIVRQLKNSEMKIYKFKIARDEYYRQNQKRSDS